MGFKVLIYLIYLNICKTDKICMYNYHLFLFIYYNKRYLAIKITINSKHKIIKIYIFVVFKYLHLS